MGGRVDLYLTRYLVMRIFVEAFQVHHHLLIIPSESVKAAHGRKRRNTHGIATGPLGALFPLVGLYSRHSGGLWGLPSGASSRALMSLAIADRTVSILDGGS